MNARAAGGLWSDTLREQKIVAANAELAERIADTADLVAVKAGTWQGGSPNDHVGEMAAIQPHPAALCQCYSRGRLRARKLSKGAELA